MGIAFDGQNIWVANSGSNTVSKLSLSGAVVGTYAVGSSPLGIAFDGTNIWITNNGSSNVTELRASDGSTVGTFSLSGANPRGIAFDAPNVWIAVSDSSGAGGVVVLRVSDGTLIKAITIGLGMFPNAVAVDGANNVWVTDSGSNQVTEISGAAPFGVLGTVTVGSFPQGIVSDNADSVLFVANSKSDNISLVVAANRSVSTAAGLANGASPHGLAFDGTHLWIADSGTNTVSEVRISDGAVMAVVPVGISPQDVVFDGTHIWVTNTGSNTVSRI